MRLFIQGIILTGGLTARILRTDYDGYNALARENVVHSGVP